MSPEQVAARKSMPLGHLSLGAVLYEMLAGPAAFHAGPKSKRSTPSHREPPRSGGVAQHRATPLDRIVRHCLEKAPDQRFQSARNMAFALEGLGDFVRPVRPPLRQPCQRAAVAGRGWLTVVVLGSSCASVVCRSRRHELSGIAAPRAEPPEFH